MLRSQRRTVRVLNQLLCFVRLSVLSVRATATSATEGKYAAPDFAVPGLRFESSSAFTSVFPGEREQLPVPRQVKELWTPASPERSPQPHLLAYSERIGTLVGIKDASDEALTQFVSGNERPPGATYYANNYAGHQFGQWAGQLGDGRAISVGEVLGLNDERFEIQLKGAGRTAFSRRGDGCAVVRSSVREFLASEAMHYLGIPTTHALAMVSTGRQCIRDQFYDGRIKTEPGAVVARVAPSFIRFGSFELIASRLEGDGGGDALLRSFSDYTIRRHYPEFESLKGDEKYLAFFAAVAERTARLVAQWQAVGFVHGVMNTDNMSVLGLTIDYGPFAFMERFDENMTSNTSDDQERYSYKNQPQVALWNLARLGSALLPLMRERVEEAKSILGQFWTWYNAEYSTLFRKKLGLSKWRPGDDGDAKLLQSLFRLMSDDQADFTNTFRLLSTVRHSGNEADVVASHNVYLASLFAPRSSAAAASSCDAKSSDSDSCSGSTAAGGSADKRQGDSLSGSSRAAWLAWLQQYSARLREDDADRAQDAEALSSSSSSPKGDLAVRRAAEMNRANPKFVLRNYLAHRAIEKAETNDNAELMALWSVLKRPFDEQPGKESYAGLGPESVYVAGVSYLSCSS